MELDLKKWTKVSAGLLVLGAIVSLVGWLVDPETFYRAYLTAYWYWLGMSLGCLAVVMLHHLVGGQWSFVIRRIAEAGCSFMPVFAILFIPVALGSDTLFHWLGAHGHEGPHHEIIAAKALYLNEPFFYIRAVIYFVLWSALALFFVRNSAKQDKADDPALCRRMRKLSAPGLILYVLSVTFASVDWAMAIEPEWFSSMYGVIFVGGQALMVLSFSILFLARHRKAEPYASVLKVDHFHDLGNMLFAFVVFWAYVTFSQYIIVWSGNLPEEISWYINRSKGGWPNVAVLLALFHFFVPFMIMLNRFSKRRAEVVMWIAGWMLAFRWLGLFWLIAPPFSKEHVAISWMDVSVMLGLGGLWMVLFIRRFSKLPALPQKDPRFSVSLMSLEGDA